MDGKMVKSKRELKDIEKFETLAGMDRLVHVAKKTGSVILSY
jgi:hypothetical protein